MSRYVGGALMFDIKGGAQIASALFVYSESIFDGLFLTISTPTARAADSIAATVDGLNDGDKVHWAHVKEVASYSITSTASFLAPLLSRYDLVPDLSPVAVSFYAFEQDQLRAIEREFEKGVVKGVGSSLGLLAAVDVNSELLRFGVPALGRPITVVSAPFSTVNPALFVGYLSDGTVSNCASSGQAVSEFLMDVRFLEGMNGGIICGGSESSEVLGLVAGSLKKANGEGEMTIGVSISAILDTLAKSHSAHAIPQLSRLLAVGVQLTALAPELGFPGVVALTVKRPGGVTAWGSGVLLDEYTVATNLHVVDRQLAVTCWFSRDYSIDVRAIDHPFEGVDLVFLTLDRESRYPGVALSTSIPRRGQKVHSIGYGIFFPLALDKVEPLHSEGIVSKVLRLPLIDPSDFRDHKDHKFLSGLDGSKEPLSDQGIKAAGAPGGVESAAAASANGNFDILDTVMVAASSGCWNGSSGGGVFSGTELVGIMASNGRVIETGQIIPTMAFVIPTALVKKAWEVVKASKRDGFQLPIPANERVVKLWKLQESHQSIIHLRPKL